MSYIVKATSSKQTDKMLEKDIENLIAQYPEEIFPNSGFKLIGQQVKLEKCFADIIFEDKYKRKIIVEVKRGFFQEMPLDK